MKIFVLYKSLVLSCVILKCSFVVTYYILNTWTHPFSQLDPNNNLTPNNYKMYERCMKDLTWFVLRIVKLLVFSRVIFILYVARIKRLQIFNSRDIIFIYFSSIWLYLVLLLKILYYEELTRWNGICQTNKYNFLLF